VLALTAAAIGVASLLMIALVVYFVRRVTLPLVTLTHFLKDTNPEQPLRIYPVETDDEVGQLVRSYNKMTGRIERLTEQVKLTEIRKKEADMQALQAQINPHFLYNTLASIHWMALMKQDNTTAEMVGSLSDFLRFSLNKGVEFCRVEQEIAHARHYGNIQSIRFPDKFELLFSIDPKLLEQTMLKLLLQPLIENALIHGAQKKAGKSMIHVEGVMDGALMTFVVEDSGIGMSPDKLKDIRGQLAGLTEHTPVETSSYGLRNVHQRLLLHYGSGAGLRIDSTEGVGTCVAFTIPAAGGAKRESIDRR
jgi:two-component system sensor histidine kinase YesM